MDFLVSIMTSSVIAGIFVLFLKESLKAKLAVFAKRIDAIQAYQAKDFDITVDSISSIWEQLAKLDDYIRYELSNDIMNSNVSNETYRNHELYIRKAMVLLPENLYQNTESSLNNLRNNVEECLKKIDLLSVLQSKEPNKKEQILTEANSLLDALRLDVRNNLDNLRKIYRDYVVNVIQVT